MGRPRISRHAGAKTPVGVKRRKGRGTSEPLIFDPESRLEYIGGFEKRKKERRDKAKQDLRRHEKAEQTKARQAYREHVREQNATLRALAEQEQIRCAAEGLDQLALSHQQIGITASTGTFAKRDKSRPIKRVTKVLSNFYSQALSDSREVPVPDNHDGNTPLGAAVPSIQHTHTLLPLHGEEDDATSRVGEPTPTEVTIDVTYGIPNFMKANIDRIRPPRPQADSNHEVVNQKKQNIIPKKYRKRSKRIMSKREKAQKRFPSN